MSDRNGEIVKLTLQRRELRRDPDGYSRWHLCEEMIGLPIEQTALLLCDVWDNHWCRGAVERLEPMISRMNRLVRSMRQKGAFIIHAPSDTMDFYSDHPARLRTASLPPIDPPPPVEHPDPPLPIDDSDGGADTGETPWFAAWTRQHPGIEIDPDRDFITDNGRVVYSLLRHHAVSQLFLMGVHTNMCVLHRSFAIKQMVRWGVPIALVRDLTDTMYNPAQSPYVPHEEGTRLVVEFIEKFWCPTVESVDLLGDGSGEETR